LDLFLFFLMKQWMNDRHQPTNATIDEDYGENPPRKNNILIGLFF
jgi:hypothetical protein